MWKDKFPEEGIYYQTGNGILYCGDCLEVMKGFPAVGTGKRTYLFLFR